MSRIADKHLMDTPLSTLLKKGQGRVHLLGASGVGMAGLAYLLKDRGMIVTGCDTSPNRLATWLGHHGISVLDSHHPNHMVSDVEWVVTSTAIAETNDEVNAAIQNDIPVFRRGDVLPELLAGKQSMVVSGTHGKTTTASFITQILRNTGRDPSWCIGGDTPVLGGVAGVGADSSIIVEADESDGSLTNYCPNHAVVTNVEFDHGEYYASVDAFEACFAEFVSRVQGSVIHSADDPGARRICAAYPGSITFGFSRDADIRAEDEDETETGVSFSLFANEINCGRVTLAFHGKHNILNTLAAFAATREMGLTDSEIITGLRALELPSRRLERIVETPSITVISDYAHHPSEIAAVISALRCIPHRRLRVVFQPHRYSRTLALRDAFPAAFDGIDELLLTPVYAASEDELKGGTEWDLYRSFRSQPGAPVPKMASSLEDAWEYLRHDMKDSDLLLVAGAGDVERIAHWAKAEYSDFDRHPSMEPNEKLQRLSLSASSQIREREPLAGKTTLKLGGHADIWIEIGSLGDFKSILRWTHAEDLPLTLIAGGSNVLVSDFGVRGVTGKLAGAEFRQCELRGALAVISAAVTIQEMLDWLESRGLTNLEFMESIPGTLGGGMQMNAGAWGKCLGDHLEWIRCLDRKGEELIVPSDALDLGYRRCEFLRERYCIEAAFRVKHAEPSAIATERAEIRERRSWMAGHRSAGSFFKNPGEEKAGRLLEAVGMHRQRVGGAWIGTHHSNFIIVENSATAADVRALAQKGREAVAEAFAVQLEPEVKYLQ